MVVWGVGFFVFGWVDVVVRVRGDVRGIDFLRVYVCILVVFEFCCV